MLISMRPLPPEDDTLVQIVNAALADAARRSGNWLVCRPGCTQCCIGLFAISPLDALRLQHGLRELQNTDPERAARVKDRAQASIRRLSPDFPGDPRTGFLGEDEESQERFEDFANDEPCPVLDPSTGLCDLYSSRPLTCRTFGPPIRTEGGLGVCELCFHGASADEIAACEMHVDIEELENSASRKLPKSGQTIVAFALARSKP